MKVRWTKRALTSFDREWVYIAKDDPVAARRVAERVLAAIEHLSGHPRMGRAGRVADTRELVVTGTPYIMIYRVRGEAVHLIHLLHGARKWPSNPRTT